ncbi:hypothetical protein AB0M12_40365 [Nocardia vinacea]|uniref:hypothetical protein n=1 Tax=Nocardia vinacea TaxID=96468 RepID=UPI003426F127
MTDELRLFEPVPAGLGFATDRPVEACTHEGCGLRSDHPGPHARLSVCGTVTAIWPAVELTPERVAALSQLLAASLAMVTAAENLETVATNIRAAHSDDAVLRRLAALVLRRIPRFDHLPLTTTQRPGREWRELLEYAAIGLPQ